MAGDGGGLVAAWYSGAWWLWLLRPVELVFRGLSALRRWCFRVGILRTYRPHRPVVIVGNITVGGTGKTPVVIGLVEELQRRGIRAGVVSRGYGASPGDFPRTVTASSSAADCGDEPLLIYRRTGCPCVVSPDRGEAVKSLLSQFEVDIIISDDGLQHYALGRDLEIALLDARLGIGNGFCLPAGPLREPASRLQTVDFVLLRGGDSPQESVSYQQDCLVNLLSGERKPFAPASLPGPVVAIAGIGQPQQFFDSLGQAGFSTENHSFADHHRYSAADFDGLSQGSIIMTEKDAVKCAGLVGGNAWYLKIDALLPAALVDAVAALAQR